MKYNLDSLDKAINRYLKDKTSTDEDFYKEHFFTWRDKALSLTKDLSNSGDKVLSGAYGRLEDWLNNDLVKIVYTNYRVKNFRYIIDLFSNDEHELITKRYNKQKIEKLVKDNTIQVIPGEDPITSGYEPDEYPCIDKYEFVNIETKYELFREIKSVIRLKEFERKLKPKVSPLSDNGQPRIKQGLEKVIYKDYVELFHEIESKLKELDFLNDNYIWQKNKTDLSNFLVTIIGFKYTMKSVKEIEVRKFFESRYGQDNNYLEEMFRPNKRAKFENAKTGFVYISAPSKKK